MPSTAALGYHHGMKRWCLIVALLLVAVADASAQAPAYSASDIPRWFADTFLEFREDVADAARDGKRLVA